MILIIGGAGSGKGEYARSLGYAENEMVLNVHELIFANPDSAKILLEPLAAKAVVTCDEVGSGVIPVKRSEREAREATGRLCVWLAKRADKVIRMVAGIPITIKGE